MQHQSNVGAYDPTQKVRVLTLIDQRQNPQQIR